MSQLPEERLGQLRVSKLRALLGPRLVGDPIRSGPLGDGAALLAADGLAAVLVEAGGPRSLGGALVWAVRHGADRLVVIVDADDEIAGRLAREAGWFDIAIEVERIVGTTSVPVAPASFPERPATPELPPQLLELVAAAAAEHPELTLVTEHGVSRVEVHGLEVARVVVGPEGPGLEVGVGRFDREISAMMFSNVPTAEALAKAAEMVTQYRTPGATTHPLRDLVPERWMRELVVADPASVGAARLAPVETSLEIASLREPQPAAALGATADGRDVVVVCTSGVDLDVVPLAADTRAAVSPEADLVICAPARNLLAPVRAVGERLTRPATFVAVELPY